MFNRTCRFFVAAVTVASLFFGTVDAFAAGFQLFNELSAKTTGNSAAMSARYDVAECAWFNPAGAAMMERPQITGGGAIVFPSMELDMGHESPDMKNMAYPIPYIYAAMPLMEKFGLSLSVNSPYGLTTEWDNDWAGKYDAQYTNLTTVFITPAVSFRPLEWLSIGAGAQIVYNEAEMRKFIKTRLGDVYTEITGHDWSQGYVVSAMAKPDEHWSFGVTFHSHVNFNIDGHAKYEYPVLPPAYDVALRRVFQRSHLYLPIDLPKTLSIAASTTAIRNFRFSAEMLWTGWSSYRDLKFHYEQRPGTGQPGVVKVEKSWNDVYSLHFGMEYFLDDAWTLRASYAWDDSPIENDYRDPSLPTNDRDIFGFGVGWAWNKLVVDAAYSYVSVHDSKPGSRATPELYGTYKGDAHIANISFSWIF